ncbi:MAG: hypothetical protein LUG24_03310 [Clostridiales bacterium]|nr:hypothetical protein [Clostridiales bacterium]
MNFRLCKGRRAESAGSFLTFNGGPLRVFLSLVCSFMGGLLAIAFFNCNNEIIFTVGFFVFLVVSSVITEIVFSMDFGAAFKKKNRLVIGLILGAVVIGLLFHVNYLGFKVLL